MNLNDTPTLDELREIVKTYDHNQDHHIIYVTKSGDIAVHVLGPDETPAGWAKRNEDSVQFRLETFAQGTGHLGERAAKDDYWMRKLYAVLVKNWQNGEVDYIGEF